MFPNPQALHFHTALRARTIYPGVHSGTQALSAFFHQAFLHFLPVPV
nr:MAG TPA: Ribulose bisphosphate carboxylase/oxygenase activase [Caudoviricetes sp.]DAY85964.1 MAG TPA: Ribulose bisphosphate carboxylase/oxygenase activase 1-helix bundle, Rubisco reactivation, Chloroplast.88A [Caudoviricetes sp.]